MGESEGARIGPSEQPFAEREADLIENGFDAAHFHESVRFFAVLVAEINGSLLNHPWLAGETLSLADIGLIPYIVRLEDLQMSFLWDRYPSSLIGLSA